MNLRRYAILSKKLSAAGTMVTAAERIISVVCKSSVAGNR